MRETRAFDTQANHRGFKNPQSRQRFVMTIFIVIILIIASFAILMVGQILPNLKNPNGGGDNKFTNQPLGAGNIHIGALLLVNENFKPQYPTTENAIINLYQYKQDHKPETTIDGFPTYELFGKNYATKIALEENTLLSFNKMMLDYCETLDLSDHTTGSASKLDVAWGYSDEDELKSDISTIGKDFYDHALGTTITIADTKGVDEETFKTKYTWLYENAHKYGFVLRYPNECREHTGFDGEKRIHLRYVGECHATYMKQNGLCLEKYLELLRTQHSYSGEHLLITTDDGAVHAVYYVPANGNPTSVPVPKDKEYSISGDNMNGFIVNYIK